MIPPSSRRVVDGETTLLTTDLIRVRRRGKRSDVTPLKTEERERLAEERREGRRLEHETWVQAHPGQEAESPFLFWEGSYNCIHSR